MNMLGEEAVVAQDLCNRAVVGEGNASRGHQVMLDTRGQGSGANESRQGGEGWAALDERVEGGVEAEVGETLEIEAVMKECADNPSPIGGVNLNEGSFQEKIDEVNAIGGIQLGFHECAVHTE
jgi:hypothetical protein